MEGSPLQANALLRCFFDECERHFRFLENRFGYRFLCGLVEYRNNYKLIKPLDRRSVVGTFQGIVRYERDERALELLYGGEEFRIDGYIYYDPILRYEFEDIMMAARKKDPKLHGDWGVTSPDLIHRTIVNMAEACEKHSSVLLNPNPKVLERATVMRRSLLEEAVRQHHARLLKKVSEDAARAFRERDYRRVVELLKPHEEYLKKGEFKKLKQAQTHLLSDSEHS